MKKTFLLATLITTFSQADFIGGEVNLGYYSHTPSGVASYNGDSVDIEKDLQWSGQSDVFLKAYLEHPLPIIPNVKLGYTEFSHAGNGHASKNFTFGGATFNVVDKLDSNLDLKMYDVALYYELLDNWVNIDVGVNVKLIDGVLSVKTTTEDETSDFQAPIPMLYAKARFDVPTTDLSFQVEGNYVSYDGNTLYDAEAGVRYTFALGLGLEAGYKTMKLQLDDIDDLSMDSDFSGAYGKLVWDF